MRHEINRRYAATHLSYEKLQKETLCMTNICNYEDDTTFHACDSDIGSLIDRISVSYRMISDAQSIILQGRGDFLE